MVKLILIVSRVGLGILYIFGKLTLYVKNRPLWSLVLESRIGSIYNIFVRTIEHNILLLKEHYFSYAYKMSTNKMNSQEMSFINSSKC